MEANGYKSEAAHGVVNLIGGTGDSSGRFGRQLDVWVWLLP